MISIEHSHANRTRGSRLAQTRRQLHAAFTTVLATLLPGRGRITPEGTWDSSTDSVSPDQPPPDPR
ncbi:MAG: hypothetical protein HKP61_20205 [Dactylosporangium sp.]|nr:hypothetical protein [Dactylosporangium sp.]NNJ63208.1 hypothetical protein [Dactylosporangium sp.]